MKITQGNHKQRILELVTFVLFVLFFQNCMLPLELEWANKDPQQGTALCELTSFTAIACRNCNCSPGWVLYGYSEWRFTQGVMVCDCNARVTHLYLGGSGNGHHVLWMSNNLRRDKPPQSAFVCRYNIMGCNVKYWKVQFWPLQYQWLWNV